MQRNILNSYKDDIAKYAGKDKILVRAMFEQIPEQLSQAKKRFIFATLQQGAPARKFENASEWIVEAGTGYHCFNVTALEPNLNFNAKRNLYKLYLHDTGILCSLGISDIQFSLLQGKLDVNQGAIVENAVAIALRQNGHLLYYYDKKSRMELDFILTDENGLTVIKVKSGNQYKRHNALDLAAIESDKIYRRIVLSKYNVEKSESGVIYYPLYMAMFL